MSAPDPVAELRHHWSGAYVISHPEPDVYIAERTDDHATLRADGPGGLQDLIRQDYAARPVRRAPRMAR